MGLQLIFVVETDRKNKSDWIYIKDTITGFYRCDSTQLKLSVVYMGGKGNYMKKRREVDGYISQYASTARDNRSKVIYCFDCDDYDARHEDMTFLQEAKKYCADNKAEFVWFCRDIEQVYLGERVEVKQKKGMAANFRKKKLISMIDEGNLSGDVYRDGSSNIMLVLDNYLKRK